MVGSILQVKDRDTDEKHWLTGGGRPGIYYPRSLLARINMSLLCKSANRAGTQWTVDTLKDLISLTSALFR